MSQSDGWIKATVLGIITMGLAGNANDAWAESNGKMEKCYGIVKKGMNQCGTPLHSCDGGATKDGDPEEWIYLPKGTCEKIVNGSSKPAKSTQSNLKSETNTHKTSHKNEKSESKKS